MDESNSGQGGTWDEAIASWAATMQLTDLAPATLDSYVRDLLWLAEGVDAGPWSITTKALGSWLDDSNWSRRTRLRVMVSIRRFYRWGVETEQCLRSPLVGLQNVKLKRSGPSRTTPTSQWTEPLSAYLRVLEAGGRTSATIDNRRHWITNLSHSFARPWSLTTSDLVDYLSRPEWGVDHRRAGRSAIRGFFAWAEDTGYVATNPALKLPSVRRGRALPRPTPDEQVLDALEVADERSRLAIEIAAYAGLRVAEISRLRWFDYAEGCLHVQGKGEKDRIVPVHAELAITLSAERSRLEQTDQTSVYMFPSSHGGHLTPNHLGKLISQCFEGPWTAHSLRHRFATQAYATARDIRAVQELLGHSKPETTARYAAVPEGALSDAVAGVRLGAARV